MVDPDLREKRHFPGVCFQIAIAQPATVRDWFALYKLRPTTILDFLGLDLPVRAEYLTGHDPVKCREPTHPPKI
jgi:hypothetical protein